MVQKAKNKDLVNLIQDAINIIGLSTDLECSKATWWANFNILSLVALTCLQCVTLVTLRELEQLFECYTLFSFCCMGLLKLHSLQVNRKLWLDLFDQIRALEKKQIGLKQKPKEEYDSDDDTLDMNSHILDYTKHFASVFKILTWVYVSTATGSISGSFIEYYFKLSVNSLGYPHVVIAWFPLDKIHIVGYFVTLIFEIPSSFYCVASHFAFDCAAVGVMIFVKGQFFLLRRYSEKIAGNGRNCNVNEKRNRRAFYRIKYSHETSIVLINIVTELDNLVSSIMGIYYLEVVLNICTVIIRLKMDDISSYQVFSLLQYLFATLLQLFLFCYYGNAISDASTVTLGQGPSGAAYWCISPKLRRELCLLAIGTAHPFRIRAGPFNFLDLPSFTMIIRAAYSAYALVGN